MAARGRGMCRAGQRLGVSGGGLGRTGGRGSDRSRVGTQGRQLARQAIDDSLLLLFQFQVHFCRRHGPWMTHGHTCRVHARCVTAHAWAQRRECMRVLRARLRRLWNCASRRRQWQRWRAHGVYLRRSSRGWCGALAGQRAGRGLRA